MAGSTLIVAGLRQRLIYTCVRGLQSTHIDGAEEEIICTRNMRLWGSNLLLRVAEVVREHGWHPPKSLDSDENLKPEHTLFCRELRFVAIYALFFGDLWA